MKTLLKSMVRGVAATAAPLAWSVRRAPTLLVLMYHRVLPANHPERAFEQPGMFVSPETLDLHLSVLKQHFELVHLDDWVKAATARQSLPRLACAITFDDGWRDNYDYAFPVLREHGAPAVIFLVSTLTGTEKQYWPNRLTQRLLAMPLQADLTGVLGAILQPVLVDARARGGWSRELIDRAIGLAKQIDEARIHAEIETATAAAPAVPVERSVVNEAEVREMAASGLVRFGSHTRTHYRFRAPAPRSVLESEIAVSGREIASIAGAQAALFCYPNGDTTDEAVNEVRQHYLAAVTTQKGWHDPHSDPFRIRRVGVHEDVSATRAAFLARLSGWV